MEKIKISYEQLEFPSSIDLDGSKSISNRLLVLKNVSEFPFQIKNLSTSDDTCLMQSFFEQYPENKLFNVQNAGTVSRFLTAFLACQDGEEVILTCAPPMKKRPILILVNALRELGAEITYLEEEGFLPLKITGKQLIGKRIKMSASVSSQYISALMMIAPYLSGGLEIELVGEIASKPYLEITQRLMEQCGYSLTFDEQLISIQEGQTPLSNTELFNESDWSAAAFYYSICAFLPNSQLRLTHLFSPGISTQGDSIVATIFKQLGVESSYEDNEVTLQQKGEITQKINVHCFDCPDMVPALAVACSGLGVEATFTGVRNLIIKESNRLVALRKELLKVGVQFEEITKDKWILKGKATFPTDTPVSFDTYEDHRIAMSLACFSFLQNTIEIKEPSVVSKSYPKFWEDMKLLGLKVQQI